MLEALFWDRLGMANWNVRPRLRRLERPGTTGATEDGETNTRRDLR